MKKRIYSFLLGCIFAFSLFFPIEEVCAKNYHDSNPDDYVTKNFNVTVEFDKSHTATITEEIKVDFRQSHHGITRNIPLATDGTYEIRNISVENSKYMVEESNNNKVIRIGDANISLTGNQTYIIHYQIEYFQDTDAKADFLAQNMLPTEWETSIRKSILTLTMPERIDWTKMQIYAGKYGENDTEAWKKKFQVVTTENTMVLTGKNFPKGYGVTLRDTNLANGYWSEARSFFEVHKTGLMTIMLFAGVLGGLTIFLWIYFGRDKKIVETVEFYPPDNMTPAEVGYALDEALEDSEMMTMVFYLADKGYLSIEPEKKHFLLRKEKNMGEEEPKFVRTFFQGLFKQRKTFHTSKAPSSFREPFEKSKEEAIAAYREKYSEVFSLESSLSRFACAVFMAINMTVFCLVPDGFDGIYVALFPVIISFLGMIRAWRGFDNVSTKSRGGLFQIVTGAIVYAVGVVFIPWLYDYYPTRKHIYAYLASQTVIFFFSLIMQKRSEKSTEIVGRLYGFRRFIKEAEYEKIIALCDEDAEYFYHILPYAAVLGLENAWTKHFEKMKIPQPVWYHSDDVSFLYTGAWCRQMLDSCTRTAVPSVPSSGSSGGYSGGSSGGGFSGGGGGGGGGGAW